MGREAFLTMYRGQKWTMAMCCAGQPIQWEDNQSPVFTTSFPQESYYKNRKTDPTSSIFLILFITVSASWFHLIQRQNLFFCWTPWKSGIFYSYLYLVRYLDKIWLFKFHHLHQLMDRIGPLLIFSVTACNLPVLWSDPSPLFVKHSW